MSLFKNPFTALMTVPAAIAIALGVMAVPIGLADPLISALRPDWPLDPKAAESLLSTIAASAMTALTLAYSLTLVVFTLAAGNIGPRLLKRFSTERANQVTAGLLGGTFLFALITLGAVTESNTPQIGTFIALLLGVASVVQLIYFVRHVSQSVSVDDEVAEVSGRLRDDLTSLCEKVADLSSLPTDSDFKPVLRAHQAGYVSEADIRRLVDLARTSDTVLRIDPRVGDYVLKGTPLLSATSDLAEDATETQHVLVPIEPARSDGGTAEFSISLLVEIALRALSPGVNDTFSALAVADMLSGALAEVVDVPTGPAVIRDGEDKIRLILPGVELNELFGKAFHPLRRASHDNILMAQGLAKAYARLHAIGNDKAQGVIEKHARLLVDELKGADHLPHDIDHINELMPFI